MSRSEMSLFDYAQWLKRRGMWIIGGGLGAAVIMALVTRSIVTVYSSTALINPGTIGENIVNGGDIDGFDVVLNAGGFRGAFNKHPELNAKVTRAWLQFSGLTNRVVVRVDATDPQAAQQAANLVAAHAMSLYAGIPPYQEHPVPVKAPRPEAVSVVQARAKLAAEADRLRTARAAAEKEIAAGGRAPVTAARIAEASARKAQLNIALALVERAMTAPDSQALVDGLRITSASDTAIGIALTPTIGIMSAAISSKLPRPPPPPAVPAPKFDKITLAASADLPTAPSWPKIQINLLIAFIFGAVAGSFAALLREP